MTRTQAEILELFQTLPSAQQRELVACLNEQAGPHDFYDGMKPGDRAILQEGIAEANSGKTATPDELKAYMAKRFNLQRPC